MGELPAQRPRDVTVLDMEASIEHLTRGTVRNVDVLLLVAEPYYRSLETLGRMAPLARELGVTGLLAVEMFQTSTGLLVNELAMRPHNSGHWTIEGARTSQFEQHLRAVLDLPLGSPSPTAPVVVMANVLGGSDPDVFSRYEHVMAHDPGIKVHFYGKEVRPGRKIGHVNMLGSDMAAVRERAVRAAHWLSHAQWTDGWDEHR